MIKSRDKSNYELGIMNKELGARNLRAKGELGIEPRERKRNVKERINVLYY